jgi:hypothetical protein
MDMKEMILGKAKKRDGTRIETMSDNKINNRSKLEK